jgi:NAD(P) transhydrogenase subunit alpha
MKIGVPTETFPGERRVALTPDSIPTLSKLKHSVIVQAGAGASAGYADQAYTEKGASVAATRADVFQADAVLFVRGYGANPSAGRADLDLVRRRAWSSLPAA